MGRSETREAGRERSALLNQVERPQPEPVSATQIDAPSDDAGDALYHNSLREYARAVGRGSGAIA